MILGRLRHVERQRERSGDADRVIEIDRLAGLTSDNRTGVVMFPGAIKFRSRSSPVSPPNPTGSAGCPTLTPFQVDIAVAANLVWLANGPPDFGGAFFCFCFRISRLPRTCPLAIAERPFDESCAVVSERQASRFEIVFCCHSLMTLVVVANTVLQ